MRQLGVHGSARATNFTHILVNSDGALEIILVSVRLTSNVAYSFAQRTNCIFAE